MLRLKPVRMNKLGEQSILSTQVCFFLVRLMIARALLMALLMTLLGPWQSRAVALDTSQGPLGSNHRRAQALASGEGIAVGIVDTVPFGIAPYHRLGDRLKEQLDFRNLSAGEIAPALATGVDGHETLVADIIGGASETYPGVAPSTEIYLGAITDDYAAMQAATSWLAVDVGARVINMSAGFGASGNGNSLRERFLDWAQREHDFLFVHAAGNNGGAINDPGGFYNGLTVGMFDESAQGRDQYSSYRLPGLGESRGKPEILAPGVNVRDGVSFGGSALYGTSFAAPHVAGTAALVMEIGAERLGGTPLGHLATKALVMNSARKRGIMGPENQYDQSFDYGAAHADDDRDYLAGDGESLAPDESAAVTTSWTPSAWSYDGTKFSTSRSLDEEQGAGLLDATRAAINALGGRYAPGAVKGIGWDIGTLLPSGAGSMATYVLEQALPAGNFLTATLVWDRVIGEYDGDGIIEESDVYPVTELANLDLRLRDGAGAIVAESISTIDNLEHLHVPIVDDGLAGDYTMEVIYNGSGVMATDYALAWWVGSSGLVAGDYNRDGTVDARDFDVWRGNFGKSAVSRASGLVDGDGNGDGLIDAADFTVWRDHVGQSWSPGAGAFLTARHGVPEPSSLLATLAAVVSMSSGWRKARLVPDQPRRG